MKNAAIRVAVVAALLGLGGCIPYTTSNGPALAREMRRPPPEADISVVTKGRLHRHDVLLLLGEPDGIDNDGARVRYVWRIIESETKRLFVLGLGEMNMGVTITAVREMTIEVAFDPGGMTTSAELREKRLDPPAKK